MNLNFPRFPKRIPKKDFYPIAYELMYLSRMMEEKFIDLFKEGSVKGTVTSSNGTEAVTIGMAMPFRPGKDVISLLHRDLGSHVTLGLPLYKLVCQYMANEHSPTGGREGNVHHGDVSMRRFPMISHLGNMLAPVVGGVWGARERGEDVYGLAVIGDGGSSTGDFHESLNLSSVRNIPVLFMIENNKYAYSTPVKYQYNCENLSDRAAGYGIKGKTIDGTDVWEVYTAVIEALEEMKAASLPYLIESRCLRLKGHAVYDRAEYVSREESDEWQKQEPLKKARADLKNISNYSENDIQKIESEVVETIEEAVKRARSAGRPDPRKHSGQLFAVKSCPKQSSLPSVKIDKIKFVGAVNKAMDYILENNPEAFILGQDVGVYGSAFQTCRGLIDKYPSRIIDTPICESGATGFSIGASQTGKRPILEYQFADFGTEAVTQLGINAGTWFFRSENPCPIVVRLPCGGGITLGGCHSGEYEGLWSRFPGLKLFYPASPEEAFEAIIAAFYDPNPCLVFEHKFLYSKLRWNFGGKIDFKGDLSGIVRPRRYFEGDTITIVAIGAMVDVVLSIVKEKGFSVDLWNPFIMQPLILDGIIDSVKKTGRFLVVQESSKTAGLGETIISRIVRGCFSDLKAAPELIASPDKPVPFAKELETRHIPDKNRILAVIEKMIGENE